MAHLLARLGRACARKAWLVVVAWLAVLGLVGGLGASFGEKFNAEITIPGTEFQTVLNDLKVSLPAAAGASGAVAFTTTTGEPFTAEQKQVVADVVARWGKVEGVDAALDPFALQAQMDAAPAQLAQAEAQLTSGQQQYDAGKAQLEASKAPLEAAKAQLDAGEAAYAAQKAQVDQLAAAAPGAPEVVAGQAQLAAVRTQLDMGQAQYAVGKAQFDQGAARLETAKAQLDQGQAKLAAGKLAAQATAEARMVSQDGTAALGRVQFSKPLQDISPTTIDTIQSEASVLAEHGVKATYSGEFALDLNIVGVKEFLGLLPALLVLVVTLGSLLAAGLPVLTSLIGVGVGLAGALALTRWVPQTQVTPALAIMLGLAVGIDYALFILNRHRDQMAQGMQIEASIARAVGTAGNAVLFAGLTVIVALLGLWLTGIPFLGLMGTVAAATVAIAVLVALTLTPAVLSLIGERVLSPRGRRKLAEKLAHEEEDAASSEAAHKGWSGFVTSHPWLTLVATTILLSVLAIPALQLKLGLPDASYDNPTTSAYQTYETMEKSFGAGETGIIVAVAKLTPDQASQLTSPEQVEARQYQIAADLQTVPGVKYVAPAAASTDKQTLAFQIVPRTGPSDDATRNLIHQLRDDRGAIASRHQVTSIGLAGLTVANIDISERLASSLPLYLAVVVGVSLVLLLLVFRSIVVPIIATAGFLLSVAASFGAVVAVYQWGWLGSAFAVNRAGPVLSFLPTLVIGILFGLAMDYQMFLVSGMREAWAHGHPAKTAVVTGFRHGARVVTAAALIMASVFASFIHADMTMVRPIGFALAIGVLLDAFVVRMTAIPALMGLLGDKAWYLPRWLDKVLPDLDIEGASLVEKER